MRVQSVVVLILSALCCASGLIHLLKIHNDDRSVFKIETFGFIAGGEMNITIKDFRISLTLKERYDIDHPVAIGTNKTEPPKVTPSPTPPSVTVKTEPRPPSNRNETMNMRTRRPSVAPVATPETVTATVNKNATRRLAESTSNPFAHTGTTLRAGFVMRKALSESAAQQDLEKIIASGACIFDKVTADDVVIDMSNTKHWKFTHMNHKVTESGAGMYSLIYARCQPPGRNHPVSFKLDADLFNPGPNYLSAGDAPLPLLYLVFFIVFSAALCVWVWVLRRDSAVNGVVHHIHYMMLILLVLKVASLLFESIRYHYISMYGVSDSWSVVYYVFAFLKGVMLFTVILLIGSGWSLMKSYLNGQEKKIIFVVLVLQVLDNIAMIILEETAPGSQGWLTWRDILHLVDIICCVAILLPIVWSIRHLRLAAEVDGKAHNSLVKLQLFRQFYVMVVVYIYFTRIVVYLISSTVPFHLLWLGPFSTELAAVIFYVVTGFKFRPAPDNPYLAVRTEDLEGAEYGLEDGGEDGLEMSDMK